MTVLIPRDRERSRFLFDWSARRSLKRESLDALTGQVGQLTRGSIGRYIDSAGRVGRASVAELRFDMLDLDGDGIRETAALVLERASTNRVWQSSNFGSTWGANNSPTRVAGAAKAGDLSLDLIGDSSGAATAFYDQSVTLVGNGTKVVSIAVKQGPSSPAGGSMVFLSDFTAPADRMNAVITWSGGLPVVTMSAGTHLSSELKRLANGIFILALQAPGVVATNTNVIRVTPAQILAQQGNIYAGGVMVEDAPLQTSLITSLAAAEPRSADSVAFDCVIRPRVLTLYARLVLTGVAQGRTDQLLRLGTSDLTSDAQNGLGLYRDTGSNLRARLVANGAHADASVAMAAGGVHELLATFSDTSVSLSIDGGAATTTAATMPTSFAVPELTLPGDNNVRWLDVRIAAGQQTLATMSAA